MTGRFRVSQSAIDRDQIPLMASDAADTLALRTSSGSLLLIGSPFECLFGKPTGQLFAEPMGKLFDLREGDVRRARARTESGVEWVVGGSGEKRVDGALYVSIRRRSERHSTTPSMDSGGESVAFRSNWPPTKYHLSLVVAKRVLHPRSPSVRCGS